MSGSPSPPRFRIRLDGGTELPVSSVEALARRLERGDLLPATPVHDSSTGLWVRAAESPVVRFILEEMWRAGDEPPPAWAPTEPGSGGAGADARSDDVGRGNGTESPPVNTESGEASPDGEASADGELAPHGDGDDVAGAGLSGAMLLKSSLDDFFAELPPDSGTHSDLVSGDLPDIDMTLVPPSDAEGREEAGAAEDVARRIEARAAEEARRAEARSREEPGSVHPDVRPEKSEWIARPDSDELRPGPVSVPRADPGSQSDRAVAAAPTTVSRRRVLPWVLILGAVVTVGAIVGALLLSGRAEEPVTLDSLGLRGGGGTAAPTLSQLSPPAPAPIPAGLEVPVREAIGAFQREIQGAVDSLSAVHGVAGAPPPPWLGGRYLSSAGAYPEVPDFWEAYRRMVEDLRLLDRELFDRVLRDSLDGSSDREADALRIERYLEERYATMRGRREDRYRQLVAAADLAIDLHEFLVSSEANLRFTPALGNAVPLDPVLEVGADSPEVLRALNYHLDELFRALDRSRGGGALSQDGLRSDLFLGFGAL